MARAGIGAPPEGVLYRARHALFVEGSKPDGLDPVVLRELLGGLRALRIEVLGPSFHVRSAAEALHGSHPWYYFLIDRDHHDAGYAEL